MRTKNLIAAAAAVAAAVGLALAARPAQADPEIDALRNAVDALTEEVRRIKENAAVPATDEELESFSGLGPGASRIYSHSSGLSIGGYGEFYVEDPTGPGIRTGDFYRLVTYVGYKFAPDLLVNSEVELEHASTEGNLAGREGLVGLEFAYLDFLPSPSLGIRVGQLLMPVGLVNEMHEPPFYRGSFRPAVERTLIPSTWRGLGAGIHGDVSDDMAYRLYIVESLDAIGFTGSGFRSGRQHSNRARFEDAAVTGRLEWGRGGVTVGASGFVGKSGQGREVDGDEISGTVTVASVHGTVRHKALEVKALAAATTIGDAAEIGALVGDDDGPVTIPERQVGGYLEVALEVGRFVGLPAHRTLALWARGERLDLQAEVAQGFEADPALDQKTLTLGAEFKPHPSVVLKADWTVESNDAESETADPLRVGAGFVF